MYSHTLLIALTGVVFIRKSHLPSSRHHGSQTFPNIRCKSIEPSGEIPNSSGQFPSPRRALGVHTHGPVQPARPLLLTATVHSLAGSHGSTCSTSSGKSPQIPGAPARCWPAFPCAPAQSWPNVLPRPLHFLSRCGCECVHAHTYTLRGFLLSDIWKR